MGAAKPPNILKRLYDWLLSWAKTPYGGPVLFVWAFAESSFFPLPPDALLVALVLGARSKALYFAGVTSIASVMGGVAGYLIGHYLWWSGPGVFSETAQFFFTHVPGFTPAQFARVQELYDAWDFAVVFSAGFTPIPYKVITVSAGAFDISFAVFVLASVVSRSARFFLVAGLLWKFGPAVKEIIDRHFNLLTVAFVVLLAAGFYIFRIWAN